MMDFKQYDGYIEGEALVIGLPYTLGKSVTEVRITDYKKRVFTSSQGDTIPYRLFIPSDYKPEIKYPLVLFHHGAGGVGSDNLANLEGPWNGQARNDRPNTLVSSSRLRYQGKGKGGKKMNYQL